jgi:Domain of unknown function (DUF4282)
MKTATEQGFLHSLFDIHFGRLITPRILSVVYAAYLLAMAISAAVWTVLVVASNQSAGLKLGLVAAAAPIYLIAAIYVRVALEGLIVLFKINENVSRI